MPWLLMSRISFIRLAPSWIVNMMMMMMMIMCTLAHM